MTFHSPTVAHAVIEPRDGLSVKAWEHHYDEVHHVWVVSVRWTDGLIQTARFTEEELGEIDALHRVRALLP